MIRPVYTHLRWELGHEWSFTIRLHDPYTTMVCIIHHLFNFHKLLEVFLTGFLVSVGTMTNIAIERSYDEKLPEPYSSCISDIESYDSELIRIITKSGKQYSQSACISVLLVFNLNSPIFIILYSMNINALATEIVE